MTTEKPHHHRNTMHGALFALIAAMLWSTQGLAVKMAAQSLPSDVIVWFGRWVGLLAFLPIFFLIAKQRGFNSFKIRRPKPLIGRIILSLLSSYCYYYALHYLSLTDAVLLSYTRPLWLPIIILIVYRRRLEPVIWFALAVGFVGVILILEPGIDLSHPASLLALLSGLIGACVSLLIRRLAKTEPADSITFHFFWMSVILSSIPLIWRWKTPTTPEVGWLILLGIIIALYQMCLTRAYRHLRASVVGAVLYSTLVFSALYDWVIWHNAPNLFTVLGICLVAGSSILALTLSHKPIVPR